MQIIIGNKKNFWNGLIRLFASLSVLCVGGGRGERTCVVGGKGYVGGGGGGNLHWGREGRG